MTLDEAVHDFSTLFKGAKYHPAHSKEVPIIWSGGLTKDTNDYPPVLYSDKEYAISSWKTWAMAAWNEKVDQGDLVLEWYQRPELIEYSITIADKLGRHRAVNNRWAVKSQFKVTNG